MTRRRAVVLHIDGSEPLFTTPTDADMRTAHRVLEWLDQQYSGRLVRSVIELLAESAGGRADV